VKVALIVETDNTSLSILKSVLEPDYAIVLAESAEDAERICEFLVPNLCVGEASNLAAIGRIHEKWPELPLLITSDTACSKWRDAETTTVALIMKPLTEDTARAKINALTGRKAMPKKSAC
jgi:hypothetical protein